MTTEVLRAVAEGAVKTAMSVEPMVQKTVDMGDVSLIISCVAIIMSMVTLAISLKTLILVNMSLEVNK